MVSEPENNVENVENQTPEEAKPEWYILKIQVNREDAVKKTLDRRIKLSGLEQYFEQTLVPTETVVEMKNGKRREMKRKLYPGYLLVKMILNDETWFLVRETTGVGDFTGAGGKPLPMTQKDVDRILRTERAADEERPKLEIPYRVGDRVKINDGTFKDIEGEVNKIDELAGRVTVIISIFSRSTPVELEYWQVEKAEV
ncbi:MAG: transcription termination/antitermination factor NusG [Thermoguttaceae bacterium]|nr:transcription termination/antitermination factor NusG [Thermoguttaceae bacterium]